MQIMNWHEELRKRLAAIDERYAQPTPRERHDLSINHVPVIKYDLVIRDLVGKVIKEIAWGLSYKDCLTLSKHFEKSRLIKDSDGDYSLHYLKVEKGLYINKI